MTTKLPHEKLADDLLAAGLFDMSQAALAYRYHDFRSELPDPSLALDRELLGALSGATDPRRREMILAIRTAHHQGVYDATKAESDEWAESEEGQDAFRRLLERR